MVRKNTGGIQRSKPGPFRHIIRRIVIAGDLAVDYIFQTDQIDQSEGNINLIRPAPEAGGSALLAARAFKAQTDKIMPVVAASVADDLNGRLILKKLQEEKIKFAGNIYDAQTRMTGFTTIIYRNDKSRMLINDGCGSANDYNIKALKKTLSSLRLNPSDFILLLTHGMPRMGVGHFKQYMEILAETQAFVIVDLVPHNIYALNDAVSGKRITLEDSHCIFSHVSLLIAEYQTLCGFMGRKPTVGISNTTGIDNTNQLNEKDIKDICAAFPCKYFDVRYGAGEIGMQTVWKKTDGNNYEIVMEPRNTGYENCIGRQKKGFGDTLTANTILTQIMGRESPVLL